LCGVDLAPVRRLIVVNSIPRRGLVVADIGPRLRGTRIDGAPHQGPASSGDALHPERIDRAIPEQRDSAQRRCSRHPGDVRRDADRGLRCAQLGGARDAGRGDLRITGSCNIPERGGPDNPGDIDVERQINCDGARLARSGHTRNRGVSTCLSVNRAERGGACNSRERDIGRAGYRLVAQLAGGGYAGYINSLIQQNRDCAERCGRKHAGDGITDRRDNSLVAKLSSALNPRGLDVRRTRDGLITKLGGASSACYVNRSTESDGNRAGLACCGYPCGVNNRSACDIDCAGLASSRYPRDINTDVGDDRDSYSAELSGARDVRNVNIGRTSDINRAGLAGGGYIGDIRVGCSGNGYSAELSASKNASNVNNCACRYINSTELAGCAYACDIDVNRHRPRFGLEGV